jgi:SPP1 family predicted phage head-tail adaptor
MGGIGAGLRDRRVVFQRAATTTDDYGGEVQTWADLEQAWARVRFGTAQEKRQAAQEGGIQSATFEVIPTPSLLGAQLTDRIQFDGSAWDITEVAPLNRQTLRFTATRSK